MRGPNQPANMGLNVFSPIKNDREEVAKTAWKSKRNGYLINSRAEGAYSNLESIDPSREPMISKKLAQEEAFKSNYLMTNSILKEEFDMNKFNQI